MALFTTLQLRIMDTLDLWIREEGIAGLQKGDRRYMALAGAIEELALKNGGGHGAHQGSESGKVQASGKRSRIAQ